ncbi:MAG: LysR family transcriptional regulator [Synergistaceae bacterium]|nr:LysR family transcriptional regulator [Synergistota bacterium]NLM72038.1 LysR family transcriptional regulator [Synergistaceae bacterium]
MDFRELQSLVEVMEKGSISGAAASLGISQPAVSKHIAKLEREMGVKLFARSQRCSVLTEEGEILYKFARKILSQLFDIKRSFSDLSEDVSGTVRISASSIPGGYILPALLVEFRRSFPNIEVEVNISDSREAVEKLVIKESDLSITGQPRHASGYTSIPFASDELVLLVSSQHPFAGREYVVLHDLEGMNLVGRVIGSSTSRIWEDAFKARTGESKHVNLKFGHVSAVVEAVKSGGDGAVVSRLAVAHNGGLVTIPFRPALDRVFYLTHASIATKAVETLLGFLRQNKPLVDE